jgi:uncharacterized protein (TIGR02611 family)
MGSSQSKAESAQGTSEQLDTRLTHLQDMSWPKMTWIPNLKWLRRAIVGVVGFSVLLVGIAMIVLPGPAFIVIPVGLAILATEFVWAAKLFKRAREVFKKEGACVECGARIDKARLAMVPPATLCLACHGSSDGEADSPSLQAISE